MLEETSYYGLVDEDFLDAIDPVVSDALYANEQNLDNAVAVASVSITDDAIDAQLAAIDAANTRYARHLWGE